MEPSKRYRELTWTSVLSAIVVGAILNAGICYAGLQIGFTIVGSTVAAVLGFGILRGIFRQGSILEVNIFQTVASSVNTVNAGIIFTVPVLFILGRQDDIDYPALILATIGGSLMGVVMIIPLRKQIIEFERLRFPEGTAVAAILKSPGAGIRKAILLMIGVGVAGVVSLLTHLQVGSGDQAHTIIPEAINLGEHLGIPGGITMVFAVHLLSLGAGYLAGKPGLAILYGTLLNYWILIPICIFIGWIPSEFLGADLAFTNAAGEPDFARAKEFVGSYAYFTSRNLGIGMILGGAIAGIIVAAPALKAVFASLKVKPTGGVREEVPVSVLNLGLAVGVLMLFLATKLSGGEHVSWMTAAIVAVVGTLWLWIAGLVVAQTTGRTDWSPLSGLALIAIAIMMGIMGTGDEFIVPAVTVGAAICVATSMCADMMADLKTGYLIGSRPIKQQIAQIATCWIGPGLTIVVVIVLWEAYAFGPNQAKELFDRAVADGTVAAYTASGGSETTLANGIPKLGAPQAGALQGAIQIVQSGDVPLGKYVTGAAIGVLVSLLVSPGLGVMVGLSMYLPFEYMIIFGMGCMINMAVRRMKGARFAEDMGVPLAAGLIVGDALVGVGFAVWKVIEANV